MLNPVLPDMPQMLDGNVEMLKACPLVSVRRMEPMGKKTVFFVVVADLKLKVTDLTFLW